MADTKDGPSLAKNMKRCNKQLMEKRRRERINTSLEQLKGLVLQATRKDSAQYSKLEKADILEMTVKHLRTLQQHQLLAASSSNSSVAMKYHAGFQECAEEVTRYLGTINGLSADVHSRLMQHLQSCAPQTQELTPGAVLMQHTTATPITTLPGFSPPTLSVQIPAGNSQAVQFTDALPVIPGSVAQNMAYILPRMPSATVSSPEKSTSPVDSTFGSSPSPVPSYSSYDSSPRSSPERPSVIMTSSPKVADSYKTMSYGLNDVTRDNPRCQTGHNYEFAHESYKKTDNVVYDVNHNSSKAVDRHAYHVHEVYRPLVDNVNHMHQIKEEKVWRPW